MRFFVVIPMEAHQDAAYRQLAGNLTAECRQAPARRDITLIGVVLNVLLAYVYSGTRDTTSRLKRLLEQAGMDLLGFPIIVFLQTGYNVYTLQQAARRSWRIGQKQAVRVMFFGYAGSSQITCLQLMAKKIAVAQSTSGYVPESGLDALNQDGDSVQMALARQLVTK